MKKILLLLIIISFGATANAQIPHLRMWQRLKQGDHLFFDSAIAVPPADFRQHYRIFHLLDKTNVAQHEVIMELRGIEAKNKAEIKKLKASITQKNKQIRDLKAQLSAKKS